MTESDVIATLDTLGAAARAAAARMAASPRAERDAALRALAARLRAAGAELEAANAADLRAASDMGLAGPLLDRLRLDAHALDTVIEGCLQLAEMPDPIGEITGVTQRPSGIRVGRMRVPLGVFGMIYESRPNVTIEAASLAIKSGNACILRGGSEAIRSNVALWRCVQRALHLDGNCHTYVDERVDLELAVRVTDNAKTQKYSPCNATESLLVHAAQAAAFLPRIGAVFAAKGVEMRGDARALAALKEVSGAKLVVAQDSDWGEEYLAPVVSIRVVDSVDEAIAHINRHGSHHTDAILTTHHPNAMRFLREVDSASVMVNASTRFADGFEYGLGAEIGISTDKFHARGPVGLEGLTSQKWIVLGEGEIRG